MIVIIGAGHAGVNTVFALRDEGFEGEITLIHNEKTLPYQRPPLSKAFMKGGELLPLRGQESYNEAKITLLEGEVTAINTKEKSVQVNGKALKFQTLILAMGGQARALPNAYALNSYTDALVLREKLALAKSVHIYGAGFIGLEFAAVASAQGKRVSVSDIAPRPLARAVSPLISDFMLKTHQDWGVEMLMGKNISREADLVVAGIGLIPNDSLVQKAGLICNKGVVVNAFLETSEKDIFALGDMCQNALLSVQNALDQAKYLAKRLTQKIDTPYAALPWFWSDQRDVKLQIAGVSHAITRYEVVGDPASRAFSVNGYEGDTLRVVESINRPADHMRARKLLS